MQTLNKSTHTAKSGAALTLEVSPQAVQQNSLNNSISKMQYSFPKSPRFQPAGHQIDTHYYDLPSTRAKRTTSLGYGNKMDLSASKDRTPAPGTYNIQSEFDSHQGLSFGLGRSNVKTNSMFREDAGSIPAPSAYNVKPVETTIKFSMRPKLEDHTDKWIKSVPGPGTYASTDTINPACKNFVSKFTTAPTAKFSILPRLPAEKPKESPSPFQYNTQHYTKVSSRFKSSVASRIGNSKRRGLSDSKDVTPGPGTYGHFSEFIH